MNNKWGQRIFETTDPVSGWEGINVPADIYGWVVTYSDLLQNVKKIRGSVVLIR